MRSSSIEKKYPVSLEITIKLSNTTGKEDINRLVEFCFEPVSSKVQVDSFKQINRKNSDAASKLIVKASFVKPNPDYVVDGIIRGIKKSIALHWQCEFKSCSVDGEERHDSKPVSGLGFFADTSVSNFNRMGFFQPTEKQSNEQELHIKPEPEFYEIRKRSFLHSERSIVNGPSEPARERIQDMPLRR